MILNIVEVINKFIALIVIASQIFILLAIIYSLLPHRKNTISDFFSRNGIKFAFIIALAATVGSLFYSGYAGFIPCSLCWFQRIFMYPEVIILGLALIKKDKNIVDYGLALSLIGLAISIYHNYIYFKGSSSNFCSISEPCTIVYVSEFHYITIPMMALTAFLLINLFLIFQKWRKNLAS